MNTSFPEISRDILARQQITREMEPRLRQALTAFNLTWK
jgi:hypothetical protein